MSTVRVYKVAELLNTTSQEVLQLLKKNHGIELKSASSTLEEIVARQFVERLARQRGIELPKGDIFSEAAVKPAKKAAARRRRRAARRAEPPKPAAPSLPPPRLIKTVRPPTPAAPLEDDVDGAPRRRGARAEPCRSPKPPASAAADAGRRGAARRNRRGPARPSSREPTPTAAGADGDRPAQAEPRRAAAAEARGRAAGRFVPPSIRLRVEEPGKAPPNAPPLQPRRAGRAAAAARGAAAAARRLRRRPRPATLARPRPAYPFGGASAAGTTAGDAWRSASAARRSRCARPTSRIPAPSAAAGHAAASRRGVPAARPAVPPVGPAPVRASAARRPSRRPAPPPVEPPPITRTITFSEGMTVKDLADNLDVRVKDALKALLDRRMMMTINSTIDIDTAREVARQFGAEVETRSFEQE